LTGVTGPAVLGPRR